MSMLLCTHAEFEAKYPDERDYAAMVENGRIAHHIQCTGSEEGFVPGRKFPCPGLLQVVGETEHHREIRCSECDFATTAPVRPKVTAGADTTEEDFWWR